MKGRKKILMLITNLSLGGAQRVFFDQSLILTENYEIIECVFNIAEGHAFKTGNKIIDLKVPAGKNFIDKIYRLIQRVTKLRRLKKELKIDICISHLEGADLVNILSKTNEKTICWVHGSKLHDENIEGLVGWLRHHLIIPFIYRFAHKVVTVSKAIKIELTSAYKVPSARVETIYNFFHVESVERLAAVSIDPHYQSIFSDRITLITAGRLARQKNHASLIKWFASFLTHRECKLIIIGDGELREELISIATTLNLRVYHPWADIPCSSDYDVYFLGFQENPFKYLRHAQLFLLPSLWEGFPMVIGEAMACKLPVLSSDCPTGPREFLSLNPQLAASTTPNFSDFGILLPTLNRNNFPEWTSTVAHMIDDSTLRTKYANLGYKRIELFSKHQYREEINRILLQ
jgi:glycosyltransferase involved in cell wall biosynthesis